MMGILLALFWEVSHEEQAELEPAQRGEPTSGKVKNLTTHVFLSERRAHHTANIYSTTLHFLIENDAVYLKNGPPLCLISALENAGRHSRLLFWKIIWARVDLAQLGLQPPSSREQFYFVFL